MTSQLNFLLNNNKKNISLNTLNNAGKKIRSENKNNNKKDNRLANINK